MKLSVLVPVFNESRTVKEVLARVAAVDIVDEIIVIDDASTDDTCRLVEGFIAAIPAAIPTTGEMTPVEGESTSEHRSRGTTGRADVKLLRHSQNRGKGAALRTGLAVVTGDVVVIQDGDLEYDPRDFEPMLNLIRAGSPVVYGSRILGGNRFSYLSFYFGGRLLSGMANFLYGLKITDEPTCYKMLRTDVLRRMDLQCERFEFCPEVTAKVARLGLPIREIPIHYAPRSLAEGKKISWRDGIEAITTLWRYRSWKPRNV